MTHAEFKQLDGVEQAVYFHSRTRRRSLAGVPELYRTFDAAIPAETLANASMPDTGSPITFWTSIRVTGDTPTGVIFCLGNATTAVVAYLDGSTITLRAGDAGESDRSIAEFENTVSLPSGLELDLVFSVRPGDGRVRIWGNGEEIARATAVNGAFTSGWSAAVDGSFAAVAPGALPADVSQTGAPSNFAVIQPLSVFTKQVPRHFV